MPETPGEIQTWPASAQAFTDTHLCPACFTTISLPTCPVCGFVLTDPRALEVLALGRGIFSYESERQRLIAEVRLAYRPAAAPEPAPAAVLPIAEPAVQPAAQPAVEPIAEPIVHPAAAPTRPPVRAVSVPREAPASIAPPSSPRRRLTVPVLLLIVGVSLVGVAAIFFLLLAWFTANIAVRALIIGAITAAAIATASLLRRRELTATAEGIAVLGVLLLALDGWAVRANDLFGTGSSNAAVYAGIAILAVGVLCRVWARLSGLRSPDIASVLALPVGLGLLAGGAIALPSSQALVIGLLGASVGGLAHALPVPWSAARADASIPRTVLAALGVLALVMAGFAAAIASDSTGSSALLLFSSGAIMALGLAHTLLLRPRKGVDPLPASGAISAVAAAVAVAVAALLGWQLAIRVDLPVYTLLVGPVVAVAVAVLVDRVRSAPAARAWTQPIAATAAHITATIIGGSSLLVTVVMWLLNVEQSVSTGWTTWHTDAFASAGPEGSVFALIAGVAIASALFFAPSLDAPVLRDLRVVAAAVLVLAGVAVTAVPVAIVTAAAGVAAAALVAMRRRMLHPGALGAAAVAMLVAFAAGTATPGLWLIGVAVALTTPIVAQAIVRPGGTAAGLFTVAPIALATVAAALAPAAVSAATGDASAPAVTFVLLQWIALAALIGAAGLRIPAASRLTAAVSAYALFVLSLVGPVLAMDVVDTGVLGDPILAIARSAGLLVVVSLIAVGRTRVAAGPALGAAALVAPLAAVTTLVVMQTFGLSDDGIRSLAGLAAATTVVAAAAVRSLRRPAEPGSKMRAVIDLGALATALVLVWGVGDDLRWAMWLLLGIGVGAASASRGWAAPVAAQITGMPTTRADGTDLAGAPRRVLAWPALMFATYALWKAYGWLDTPPPQDAFTLPPAIALLAFAALLVWLRRHVEAALAMTAACALGLLAPALAGWFEPPLRGTIIVVVAAAFCLMLTWTPLRRARLAARAGAITSIVAVAMVCAERAFTGPPTDALWLVLLIAVAYASGFGAANSVRSGSPAAVRRSWFATVVPPLAVAVAMMSALPSAHEPTVVAAALLLLAVIHLGSAWLDRTPLAATSRWVSLAAMGAYGAAGLFRGAVQIDGVVVIELVSVPIALTVMTGSVLAGWMRGGSRAAGVVARERGVWLIGLLIAVLPSVIAPAQPLRAWVLIGLALCGAAIALLLPVRAERALRTSSAALMASSALLMAARVLGAPIEAFTEPAALAGGGGAVLIAALMVGVGAPASARLAAWIGAAGAVLVLATTVLLGDGNLVRTAVTAVIAGVVGVGGAALLGNARWRALGAVLAIGGFVGVTATTTLRFFVVSPTAAISVEADLWAVVALALTAAIGIMALRSSAGSPRARTVGSVVGGTMTLAVALFAGAEWLLITDSTVGAAARTVATMTILTAIGVGGALVRARLGLAVPVGAGISAVLFGLAALTAGGVRPIELVTAPPAVGLVLLGVRTLRRHADTRSWPALGPGLALLTVPPLLYDFGDTELWRIVSLGVLAVALVVVGAVQRLQAPLVLGSAVLLVHAVAQLWPWISAAYVFVPWWLWLGIGGALLIYLAARYERRMRAVRTAFATVAGLR